MHWIGKYLHICDLLLTLVWQLDWIGEYLHICNLLSTLVWKLDWIGEYLHICDLLLTLVWQVDVEKVYTHGLEPFPAEISQSEKQLVRFIGNHYLFTPYAVQQQTTKVVLASANVESYTKLKPSQLTDTTITLGPYDNVPEYSQVSVLTATGWDKTLNMCGWLPAAQAGDIISAGGQR